jgi:hypothetical protein
MRKPRYLEFIMSKLVKAEYDAAQNTLRLVEPLHGIRDHEQVEVQVTATGGKTGNSESSSMALKGILSEEAGQELSRLVNEMFPPWK